MLVLDHWGEAVHYVCSQTCLSRCRFMALIDINSNYHVMFHCATRWLSFSLDSISACMTLTVALFVVLSSNESISPSLKGLALSYTMQVTLENKMKAPVVHLL